MFRNLLEYIYWKYSSCWLNYRSLGLRFLLQTWKLEQVCAHCIKMCYISKHSLAAVWMNKNLPESLNKPSLTTMMKKHQLLRTKGLATHQMMQGFSSQTQIPSPFWEGTTWQQYDICILQPPPALPLTLSPTGVGQILTPPPPLSWNAYRARFW